jgi:hypothetical protein
VGGVRLLRQVVEILIHVVDASLRKGVLGEPLADALGVIRFGRLSNKGAAAASVNVLVA